MDKKIIIIIAIIVAIIVIGIGAFFLIKGLSNNKTDDSKPLSSNSQHTTSSTDKSASSNKIVNEEITEKVSGNKEETGKNIYSSGKHHAKIKIKEYGTIELELNADVAPITVANFAKLVNEGFYNGLTFHRIINGFMMQGGDPLGNGSGGSEEKIKGEFSKNGVKNTISHVRGVISMARATPYNSASSQFFIVHKDSTFLDGEYAAFGKVTSGMDIVDKICEEAKVIDSNGTVLREDQPVIDEIVMVD